MSAHHSDKNFKQVVEELSENTQLYVKKNVKSVQLEIYERLTNLISSGVNLAIFAILGMFVLFFLNFGIAQLIGEQLGRPSLGYLIVAGFYLILLLGYLIFRKVTNKRNTIKNAILKNVSKEHTNFNQLLEEQLKVQGEIDETFTEIQKNVDSIKLKIYGSDEEIAEQKEIYNSVLPRPLLTSSIDFLFRRFIFKKETVLKNKLTPLLVELLVSSILFSEGKLRAFITSLQSKNNSKNE
jgi:predicted transcriptional regulator